MTFWERVKNDSELRDAFRDELQSMIDTENKLDRVDDRNSLDLQRGKVMVLRSIKDKIASLDRKDTR